MCHKDIAEEGGFSTYGKIHPEYFALVGGVRQVSYHASGQLGGQLCVSNLEMIKEYANYIIRVAKKEPVRRMCSLCQNDGCTHFECKNCRALDIHEIHGNSAIPEDLNSSDRIMKFQKEVARLVLEEIPDARFT